MSIAKTSMRKSSPDGKDKRWYLSQHKSKCKICNSPHVRDIETDYIHCIPWTDIERRYSIDDHTIEKHARAFELHKKRDRNLFYWKMIEKFDYNKVTAENAIEAAKQLDRLEHKLADNATPSNISIVYSYGDKIRAVASVPTDPVLSSDRPSVSNT